jgi:D-sedoheptulose 7-phosphate isomerase
MSFIKKNKNSFIKVLKNISFEKEILKTSKLFKECSQSKNKVIFLGNGGSASIASHVSVDLTKNAKIRSVNFNEANLITCFANDFGHENWMKEALKMYCDNNDVVVLISSSGKSRNIVNAAEWCVKSNLNFITLTGNNLNNPLKKKNKNGINFWINSKAYNHIELAHLFILLSIVDLIIGRNVYKA